MWTYTIINESLIHDDPVGEAKTFATGGWSTSEKAMASLVESLLLFCADEDFDVEANLVWEDDNTFGRLGDGYVKKAWFDVGECTVYLYKMVLLD